MDATKTRLQPEELTKFFQSIGVEQASVAAIKSDIEDGLPVANDGSISIIAYLAWMVKHLMAYGFKET